MIDRLVEAFNAPVLALDGFEADDLIATLSRAGRDHGFDVVICTSDKDCRQLLGERVRMYSLRKQTYFDVDALKGDWGVGPEQVVDFQTLVGDPVDNVPGAPGVGPKTATKLLQQFGTLDNLLAHIDEVTPERIRKAIADNAVQLAISRKLVTLACDVPIDMTWDAWRLRPYDAAKLAALFDEYGFRGFAARARSEAGRAPPAAELFAEADGEATGDFPFGANAPAESHWISNYTLIDSPGDFSNFVAQLRTQHRIVFDLETTGLDPLREELVGIALTWEAGKGYYLPVRGPADEKRLDERDVLAALQPVLEDSRVAKVNQNIKFDLLALRQHGINVRGVAGDPMVADYLLRSGERSHGLDELARRLLNHENIHIEELIGKRGKNQLRMDQVPCAKVAEYAGEDVDVAWRLADMLEAELVREGLKRLYDELEVPLIPVLAEMEFTGIRLDAGFLKRLSDQMSGQLAAMEREIHRLAGREFNIGSLSQLRVILFDELKLPIQKKTTITGASSTDQETLERLAPLHPLPRKIVEYRQVAKLKGTYVDALPALLNPGTGRLHTSFNQAVATTGRLSSSDPNLQNIPTRTDQGREIRQAFIPEEGWRLVTADYSQIELRLLAHFSGDANLRAAFAEKRDVHASVAARIFNVAEENVSKDQRRVAKTVNFGVIYGMSPVGLAVRLGIDRETAAKFIDDYFARFPAVQQYQARLLADCHRTGHVSSILGRRRTISGVRAKATYKGLNQPEREAVNMEIQASAADMMKRAMLGVHRRMTKEGLRARMLLTVHDELVFEAPPDEVQTLAKLACEEMIAALPLEVPVEVDVSAGANWLDVERIKVC
jgi:DNA polymerase-1